MTSPTRMRPNPSLERTSTGMALGPRGCAVYHQPRGPSAMPAAARSAQALGRMNKKPSAADIDGRAIEVGDWIRVLLSPPSVRSMPRPTQKVFRAAVGKTFQVEAFDGRGYPELKLDSKVPGLHTIWIEPGFTKVVRRPTKYSNRFRQVIEVYRRVYGHYPLGTYKAKL
jgi:hypothetical protein